MSPKKSFFLAHHPTASREMYAVLPYELCRPPPRSPSSAEILRLSWLRFLPKADTPDVSTGLCPMLEILTLKMSPKYDTNCYGSGRTLHLCPFIKQAKKQLARSDLKVLWGQLYGTRPKC